MILRFFFVILFSFSVIYCDEFDDELFNDVEVENKILKTYNKGIFTFNEFLYDNLLSKGYKQYNKKVPLIPRWILKSVHENYNHNPKNFILSILDLDLEGALISFWRFTLNSTIGLFGIIDIATQLGIPAVNKDLGMVLADYGVPEGPYIVLPIVGGTFLRHSLDPLFAASVSLTTGVFTGIWLPIYDYTYAISPFGILNGGITAYTATYGGMYLFHSLIDYAFMYETLGGVSFDKYSGYKSMFTQNIRNAVSYNQKIRNARLTSDNPYFNNLQQTFLEDEEESGAYDKYDLIVSKESLDNSIEIDFSSK